MARCDDDMETHPRFSSPISETCSIESKFRLPSSMSVAWSMESNGDRLNSSRSDASLIESKDLLAAIGVECPTPVDDEPDRCLLVA